MALDVFEGEWTELVGKPSGSVVADLPEEAEVREEALTRLAAKALEESSDEEEEWEEIEVEGEEDDDPRTRGIRGKGGGIFVTSGWRRTLKGNRFKLEDARIWNIRTPTGTAVNDGMFVLMHAHCSFP
jgi:hypothetical protein